MPKTFCPHDRSVMFRGVQPLTLEFGGKSMTENVSGWYCKKCDEAIYGPQDSPKIARMQNRLKGSVFGFLSSGEIRRIRKKIGLTQKDAGLKIGGGIRAFQKYESGDLLPSQGIDSALRLLDHDPSQIVILEARNTKLMSKTRHSARAVESSRHA